MRDETVQSSLPRHIRRVQGENRVDVCEARTFYIVQDNVQEPFIYLLVLGGSACV